MEIFKKIRICTLKYAANNNTELPLNVKIQRKLIYFLGYSFNITFDIMLAIIEKERFNQDCTTIFEI
jgi:hypothetical protein